MKLFDNENRIYSISEGCPWYEQQQTYGAPNVKWCEHTRCGWITEPANTWSNLGFIIVGFLLLRRVYSSRVRVFGAIVLFMGLLSAYYHATNNYFTQHLDFLGMTFMMSFLFPVVFERITLLRRWGFYSVFWFFVSMNLSLLIFLPFMGLPIQLLMFVNAAPLVILEVGAAIQEKQWRNEGFFIFSIFTLAVAQIFAQLDLKRIYCDPYHPWLHGHVLWHLLCAWAMYLAAQHIQFHVGVAGSRRD